MVKYSKETSRVFSALSDPTRFDIVRRLNQEETMTAGSIASPYQMSLPAISKHLRVLENAKVIKVEKFGRQRIYRTNQKTLGNFKKFIENSGLFWENALERLVAHVESKHFEN